MKFFLGQTLIINAMDDELKKTRQEIVDLVKQNKFHLELEFKCYLVYLHLKKLINVKE